MQFVNNYTNIQKFLAITMMSLLVLLTSINFFVYGENSGKATNAYAQPCDDEQNFPEESSSPAGPDEKNPGNPVSVSEEYLHGEEEAETLFIDNLIHQLLAECSKVHSPHFELDTPPPDFTA